MTDITEGEDGQEAAGDEQGSGGKKKLIVFGAVGLALVLVAGGAGFFLMQSGGGIGSSAEQSMPVNEVYFFDLPEITVNLNTGGGDVEFLKLMISLEVRDRSMMSIIEPRMPRVLDTFQVYLRELRRVDLEGSAGVYRLKEELQRRVNLAVYPATVDNILFKEILIQ